MNVNQNEIELDFHDSEEFFLKPNRRDFFKLIGAGIVILFSTGDEAEAQQSTWQKPPR